MDGEPPLIVDVDGSLVRTDLLWEGLVQLARQPARLPGLLRALLGGRAALKAFAARHASPVVATVPLAASVESLMEQACAEGRPVVLVSGAHETQVEALRKRVGANLAWGSDGAVNLTGRIKLERIETRFSQFDYVGNALADVAIWVKARRAYAVNAGPVTLWRARRARPDLVVLREGEARWRAWGRALRPHQWTKNLLLFVPALAAHLPWSLGLGIRLLAGFAAFSLAASSVYIVNDIIDAPHDRSHRTKRRRPFAAGELGIPSGLAAAAGLAVVSMLLALQLPKEFQVVLLLYLALTLVYSYTLKRRPLLDVMVLATLYTIRVVAGGALVGVPLTRWFLAFSIFLFLSLALVKRVVELRLGAAAEVGLPSSRGYVRGDIPVLTGLGGAAAVASALVYCLYITDDDVWRLYQRPDLLWAGLPLLLYWQARVWLLTGRDVVHEDPLVFAMRDPVSYAVLASLLLIVYFAI